MLKHGSYLLAIILVCFFFVFALLNSASASLKRMKSRELDAVRAQAGINIGLSNATFYDEFDKFTIHDSDTNVNSTDSLVFEDMIIGDGQGWGYSFSTNSPLEINMIEYDPTWGGTYIALKIACTDWEQNINYSIDNIKFCNKDLGSLDIGQISMPSFELQIAPPFDEESGIYFKHARELKIENIKYNYNNADDELLFKNLHMAQSFDGDPKDPDSWSAQGKFQTGAMDGEGMSSFAKFNIVEENDLQKLKLNLPMEGSLRIENIKTPDQDMGPIVLDGIKVHKMETKMVP